MRATVHTSTGMATGWVVSKVTTVRQLLLVVLCLLFAATASAQVRVKGYTKANGTYVAPHYRSAPNNSRSDNYSTRGNVNPYTGQAGTVKPYPTSGYQYTAPMSYAPPAAAVSARQTIDPDLEDGTRSPKSLSPDEAAYWSNSESDANGDG